MYAVASCGSILLARSSGGKAFASRDVRFEFKRKGQAVRTFTKRSPQAELLTQFETLKDFDDSGDLNNYAMLLATLGNYVGEEVPLLLKEDAQRALILARGPELMKKFAAMLPASLPASFQQAFRNFNIFKAFPTLRI
jgi:hypothetical protein